MNTQQELVNALQTIPWLQEFSPEHFGKIVEIASLCGVDTNQEIFHEGDADDYMYIVLQGRVAIDIFVPGRGRTRVYTAEPMDVIGWSSVVPVVRQRTAGARAVLPSHIIRLDANKLRILCEQDRSLGYIVMRKLANVVAIRLLTTRLQLLDIFTRSEAEEEMNV